MTPDCARVLRALQSASRQGGLFTFLHFNEISRRSGLPRRRVRLAARRLARMGLAKFQSGLCTEDGEFYGSGYAATGVESPDATR